MVFFENFLFHLIKKIILIRIWSVRYNSVHDQLVLTGSSDNKVVLSAISSLSSEPFKTIVNEENDNETKLLPEPDKLVKIYEDHEDSVYSVEWSSVDPWIFASLSYDGRLIINKVPKDEKFRILL